MTVCAHRLGVEETDTGPVCTRSDCQEPLCVLCQQRELSPESDDYCCECLPEARATAAEARADR